MTVHIVGSPVFDHDFKTAWRELHPPPVDLFAFGRQFGRGELCDCFSFGGELEPSTQSLIFANLSGNLARRKAAIVAHTTFGVYILCCAEGEYYIGNVNTGEVLQRPTLVNALECAGEVMSMPEVLLVPYFVTPSTLTEVYDVHIEDAELLNCDETHLYDRVSRKDFVVGVRRSYLGTHISLIESEQRFMADIYLDEDGSRGRLKLIFDSNTFVKIDHEILLDAVKAISNESFKLLSMY
jgi:hypothetical protein